MAKINKFPAMRFPNVAARVFNTPLLIEQSKLQAILGVLAPRMGFDLEGEAVPYVEHSNIDAHMEYMAQLEAQDITAKYVEDGGYYLVNGQTAVIPVVGTLVQRSDWMMEASGMTSYATIERKFNAAMNDRKVQSIVFEIDSPGGEVAGAFDMADRIYQARGDKPITAVASEKASSGAYLIASAADEIVLPRTGHVGSVGVVASHYDYSRALEKRGVAVTLLYAGEKKVDGHPFGPLDERVMEEWMQEISDVYDLFVNTISRNLGIGEDRVRGTQAGVYMGSKAVDAGLAHRVNTLSNELINSTLRTGGGQLNDRLRATEIQEIDMPDPTKAAPALTAEDVSRARSEGQAAGKAEAVTANEAAVVAARAEAATAERTRVKGILTHVEAEGRGALAQHLACSTDMSVESAGELLKNSPKGSAVSPLNQAMQQNKGAGIRQEEQQQDAGTQAATVAANVQPGNIYAKRAQQASAVRQGGR